MTELLPGLSCGGDRAAWAHGGSSQATRLCSGASGPSPWAGKMVPPVRAPVFSFQMAEQLMTLAYDNGINLFDTAEVYAAGKYVPFFTGRSDAGQPQLPWEEPELLLLQGLLLPTGFAPPTLPAFLNCKRLGRWCFHGARITEHLATC